MMRPNKAEIAILSCSLDICLQLLKYGGKYLYIGILKEYFNFVGKSGETPYFRSVRGAYT